MNCDWDIWEGCIEKKSDCIKKDLLYDGFDLGNYAPWKASAAECACACRDEERCSFFTWNMKDKRCHMKSSIGKRIQQFGSYSGSVNCCQLKLGPF